MHYYFLYVIQCIVKNMHTNAKHYLEDEVHRRCIFWLYTDSLRYFLHIIISYTSLFLVRHYFLYINYLVHVIISCASLFLARHYFLYINYLLHVIIFHASLFVACYLVHPIGCTDPCVISHVSLFLMRHYFLHVI